ncbi:hypothetical protein [Allorhodopirellula solitaria]|uniref:Uncharacterized protein n=1 Tax=Allorhodopirellula solitaria TaxID=2527987 RepID=A0A5C5YEQ1_9BACT|nr:hypothetical protein [Allorhodopirellula solitaria]TWT73313.1 hypothetical protein CA85_17820 [Allorhodopirellula solitaria]
MRVLSLSLPALLVFVAAGCEGDLPVSDPNGPSVLVTYQSQPLADVQVCLHESASGPVLAQAVSAADGQATFREIPAPEPSEYSVSLQSLSDGGWILDPKYTNPAKSLVRLAPLGDGDPQTIELPRGAVRPLTRTR